MSRDKNYMTITLLVFDRMTLKFVQIVTHLIWRSNILPEKKLFIKNSVSFLGPMHVFIDLKLVRNNKYQQDNNDNE